MQPTTASDGGSRARIIYHTPGKSFAWLHKDGSFADFKKALRARLNISKHEPLVIKQIDGDYTLDIETEEEYEAFCHVAKSTPQLHVSVNGGLQYQSKPGGLESTSSSATLSTTLATQPPAESEDPALGKRKASQITTDPEAALSTSQKRKKRRKVGPDQPISAVDNSAITTAHSEPQADREAAPANTTHGAASTSEVADPNQSPVSKAKKKKKRKNAGLGQSDSTPAERHAGPPTESTGAPGPPPDEQPKSKKRKKKTVVLDLSTVIPPPATAQESSSIPNTQPPSPELVTEPPLSMTQEITKKSSAKKKSKALAEPPEPTPSTSPVSRPTGVDEPIPSSATAKPKPPVSKSGFPRQQVYVEIITKKRKTGKADGSNAVEKEPEQQDDVVEAPAQLKVGKPKGKPRKSKTEPNKRIESPNAPSIQDIMDGVIAAAMQNAKKRMSASEATSDVGESVTPPPLTKSQSAVRRHANASRLGIASSSKFSDVSVSAPNTMDSDSTSTRKKARKRKLGYDSPFLPPSLKSGAKLSTPITPPPPNQQAMQKPSHAKPRSEEESTPPEDEDSDTPKRKPLPVSDPDDELDAFLHAPTHPSQKSVLEELQSDSEDEDEEVEREDMEVDEEDEAPKSKGTGHGRFKVTARAISFSDDDSDSESVASDVSVRASKAKANTQVTHVSETQDVVPSSDIEDEEEPLSRLAQSPNTSTNVIPPASSTPDSAGPHMTAISKLKSADQAVNFFNEHVLDREDPIENESSHTVPPRDLPEDTEDPIQSADTTSTPKPKPTQGLGGRDKTTSPVSTRKNDASPKATRRSLTSPPNSMLPPPSPLRKVRDNLKFGQPLDQSTPAGPNALRKKQLASQTAIPETPTRSTWTTLPQGEQSAQSADDPQMIDELISSPTESTSKLPKATPVKKPASSGLTKQTPLFLPNTSQFPILSSDVPAAEKTSSEESESEEEIFPQSQRVLRSSVAKNRTVTPYRSLSVLASQRSIFPQTPIEPVEPAPANRSQSKPGSDDDEEDSAVSESESDSPPPSHIPKGRRAGVGNGGRERRSQLATWS